MTEQDAPKNEPEKKPAALDAAGFDLLEASLNELSKAAATQSLTYLLLWLYLFFTVTAVTDYDLLIENPIKLPIFNLEIGLLKFFIAAPPLFWLVQLYMVRKLAVIAEAVGEYLTAAEQQAKSAGAEAMAVLERLRHRADGFVITRLLTRFDDIVLPDGNRGPASSDLATALTVLAAGATLVVAPLLLYFSFQYCFLAYQSEGITWWHRIVVFFGLMLCIAAGRTAKLSWGASLRALPTLLLYLAGLLDFCKRLRLPDFYKRLPLPNWRAPVWLTRPTGFPSWVAPVAVLWLASLTVLTFPGETMSEHAWLVEQGMGGGLAEWAGVPRTLHPKAVFDREAVAKALGDGMQPGKLDDAGPPPLDLRRRDFSYRSLRGINLAGAWLQGANLGVAQLQGANLWSAHLQNAILWSAQCQGADLSQAQIKNAELGFVQFQGAKLEYAELQGANIAYSQLQCADFNFAHLEGADLRLAQLQCADLGSAHLEGANFYNAQFYGTSLTYAQLNGAYLEATGWWRAKTSKMASEHAYFIQPASPDPDAKPDSPEKFRPLAAEWLKQIPQGARRTEAGERLRSLTEDGDPDDDRLQMQEIQGRLQAASDQSSPQARALYLADLACPHPDGKYMLPNMIHRSWDRNDVSAAALSDRLKDTTRCPAAKELSAGYWNSLAKNVEREKSKTEEPQ